MLQLMHNLYLHYNHFKTNLVDKYSQKIRHCDYDAPNETTFHCELFSLLKALHY